MKSSRIQTLGLGFLTLTLVVATTALAVFNFVPTEQAQAAPPESLTVSSGLNGVASTECRFVMANDTLYSLYDTQSFILGGNHNSDFLDSIESNASLNADWQTLIDRNGDNAILTYIYMTAVNPGSGTQNEQTCNNRVLLFSRPSDPTQFFGIIENISVVRQAYYSPASQQLVFLAGGRGVGYNITEDADSPGILTNPMFGTGSGGGGGGPAAVGFCSQYDLSGLEGLRANCMRASVVNFNAILYRGETYTLRSWTGDTMYYYITDTDVTARDVFISNGDQCKPYFRLDTADDYDLNVDGDRNAGDKADVFETLTGLPATGQLRYQDYELNCAEIPEVELDIQNFRNLRMMFAYFANGNVVSFDVNNPSSGEQTLITGNGQFTAVAGNATRFEGAATNTGCSTGDALPRIVFDSDPSQHSGTTPLSATWFYTNAQSNCGQVSTSVLVRYVGADSAETPEELAEVTGVGGAGTGGADTTETEPPQTCATTLAAGSALGWVLCPIINLAEEMIDVIETVVRRFLFVDVDRFDSEGGLFAAWNNIRVISTIIIVIIALIMIFSEAMGAGIMDTYSVKKLLPRLVFAGIAIQFSWVICKELVNIGNILGNGLQGLLLAPFPGLNVDEPLTLLYPTGELSGTAQGGAFVIIFAGGAVAFGALATIAIGILIALIVAFVTLMLRYMVIILCIMFAPIAIAMSVLPGTQKLSKLWWESFEKAIAMYPVIMALFAAGKITFYGLIQAARGDGTGEVDGWLALGAMVAFFAPYALLPTALKAGGTALGKLTGAFNNGSRGFADRARNFGKQRQEWRKKVKDSDLAMKAGAGSSIAAARLRMKSGQNVSGLSLRKSRRKAMDRGFEGLQLKAREEATKEADAVLQKTSSYNNANGPSINGEKNLVEIARTSKDSAERQAAINRIASMKDDGAMRALLADSGRATEEISRAYNSGAIGNAYGDKAPDIAGAKLDQATGRFTMEPPKLSAGPKTHSWTADTWERALDSTDSYTDSTGRVITAHEHYAEILASDPIAASNIDAKKKAAIEARIGRAINLAKPATALPTPPTPPPPSDIRLKHNIVKTGRFTEMHGLPIYTYQYVWEEATYEGVMAQDVMRVVPEAVVEINGFYHVRYELLGTELKRK
jgi:hypothetical protein